MTYRHRLLGLGLGIFVAASSLDAQPQEASASAAEAPEPAKLSFNFKGVPIDTVLDYLAKAAGFTVVRNVPLNGTVDVVSHRPLDPEESLELVTSILHEKGYAAVRSGRTLNIVSREDAKMRDIPVRLGADPASIPKNDEMVTQIIPIRYSKASELVDNLKPLLPSYSTITANEGSNTVLLTDTQANVHRIAEIITALDQSFSEISSVRVFQLRHAQATDTAKLITDLFKQEATAAGSGNNSSRGVPSFFRRGGGFPGGGDDNNNDGSSGGGANAVVQASSRVTAVADERTNSIVVAAPPQLMANIEELITTLDLSNEILTEVRVFPLKYADAQETADIVESIFNPEYAASSGSQQNNVRVGFGGRGTNGGRGSNSGRGGFGGFPPFGGGAPADSSDDSQQSATSVVAVADTRTNSLVVSAVSEALDQIAGIVQELDRDPSGTKKVYIYSLKNANPEDVATLLDEMFSASTTSSNTTRRSNTANTSRNNGGTNANRNANSNANRSTNANR